MPTCNLHLKVPEIENLEYKQHEDKINGIQYSKKCILKYVTEKEREGDGKRGNGESKRGREKKRREKD